MPIYILQKGLIKGIGKMGINITQTNSFLFENKENLRNTAKHILYKQGASTETLQKIDKTIFGSNGQIYPNAQLAIIKASTQISVNHSLKETLKYLKNHASKKVEKKPVLGELWNLVNDTAENESYKGELLDFEIDLTAKNIFAAA